MSQQPHPTAEPGSASVDPNSVEGLFVAALGKASPEERAAFLDEACGGDAGMRRRVDALLRAYDDAGSFLEKPAVDQPTAIGDDEVRLDFLTPTDKPDRLGMLGHYEVIEVIGRGGMGIVLRALDPKLNRVVAIKALVPELAANPNARRRFTREAQTAASISHPHIVTIHAVEEMPWPFLVMECVAGQSLQEKLDKVGSLRLTEVLRIGRQIAEGLSAAHKQGLIHRDIKPANILLENGVERVKITDFGLARTADDVAITKTGEVHGTPQYMSPEQARGERVDHRSDLFSLGCVLYAMCSGRPPFRAESLAGVMHRVINDQPRSLLELNPETPSWLIDIVTTLISKDPVDRYQSADEVAAVLEERLAIVQGAASAPDHTPKIRRRRVAPLDGGREQERLGRGTLLATPASQFALMVLAWMCGSFVVLALFTALSSPGGMLGNLIRVTVVYGGAALVLLPAIAITAGRRGYPVFNALLQGSAFVLVSWLAMDLWVMGLTSGEMDVIAHLLSIGPVVLVVAAWSIYRVGVTRIAGAGNDGQSARMLSICGVLTWLLLILLFGMLGPHLRATPLRDWVDGEVVAIYLYRAWLGAGLLGAGLWLSRNQREWSPWRELWTAIVMTVFGPISLLAGLGRVLNPVSIAPVERPIRKGAHAPIGRPARILLWLAVAAVSLLLLAPCLIGIPWYFWSSSPPSAQPVSVPANPLPADVPYLETGEGSWESSMTQPAGSGALILELQDAGLSVELRPQNTFYLGSGTFELRPDTYWPLVRDEAFGWIGGPADEPEGIGSAGGDGMYSMAMDMGGFGGPARNSAASYYLSKIEIEAGTITTLNIARDFVRLAEFEPEWSRGGLYRFLWSGEEYLLSRLQAKAVDTLLEAFAAGDPDRSASQLEESFEAEQMEPPGDLRALFNDGAHPAWRRLVVADESDETYRLADPDPSFSGRSAPSTESPMDASEDVAPAIAIGPKLTVESNPEFSSGDRNAQVTVDIRDTGLFVAIRRRSSFTGENISDEETVSEIGRTDLTLSGGTYEILLRDTMFGWRQDRIETVEVAAGSMPTFVVQRDFSRYSRADEFLRALEYQFAWNGTVFRLTPGHAACVNLLLRRYPEGESATGEELLGSARTWFGLYPPALSDSEVLDQLLAATAGLVTRDEETDAFRLAPAEVAPVKVTIRHPWMGVTITGEDGKSLSIGETGEYQLPWGDYRYVTTDRLVGWRSNDFNRIPYGQPGGEIHLDAGVELEVARNADYLRQLSQVEFPSDSRSVAFTWFSSSLLGQGGFDYQFALNSQQADCVKVLLRALADGEPEMTADEIDAAAGLESTTFLELFEGGVKYFGITHGEQPDTYRLTPPPADMVSLDESLTQPPEPRPEETTDVPDTQGSASLDRDDLINAANQAYLDRLINIAEQEHQRLVQLHGTGAASAGEVREAEVRLLVARIRKARALSDDAAVADLLGEIVALREARLAEVEELFRQAVVPATEVNDAREEVLEARLQLAEATGDDVETLLGELVTFKEEDLQLVEQLAENGVVGEEEVNTANASVIEARLRLAAEREDIGAIRDLLEQLISIRQTELEWAQRMHETGYATELQVGAAESALLETRILLEELRE